jgi:hypothetical protein
MRKAGILALVLFLAPALMAQDKPPGPPEQWAAITCYVPTQTTQPQAQAPAAQQPKRPHPLDPADVETLTGRPYQDARFGRAPKPGHPLDWNDVEILTGIARGAYGGYAYRAVPYVYVSPYAPLFGNEMFAPVSTRTRPLFAPRLFPRMVSSPFVIFR